MSNEELRNTLKLYGDQFVNEKAKKIVSNSIYDDESKINVDNIVKEIILNDRYYLYSPPKNKEISHDLILFYHGSRDIAWTQILEYTNLVENNEKFIIAFGQASGTINKPEIHPEHGYASFGEIFWSIDDLQEQFTEDLLYTKAIIGDIKEKHLISDVYFIGHSNGGVFALLLALYTPNLFKGIASHMGGIGYDSTLNLNFKLLSIADSKTPMLFYTGEYDLHKKACETAVKIFLSEGFPRVDIFVERKLYHEYKSNCETFILNWLMSI